MKIMGSAFIGATIAIFSLLPVASAGPNLLANGDFELYPIKENSDTNYWTWKCAYHGANNETVYCHDGSFWDSTVYHGGKYSVRVENGGFYHSGITLKPLTKYTVTYWAKTNFTAGGYCSRMDLNSANGFVWMTWGILNTGVSDWKQVVQSFTTPVASGLNYSFDIVGWEGGHTGTEWVDDIVLTEDSIQPLLRIGWKASASSAEYHSTPDDSARSVASAIDGNGGSRWSTGGAMSSGQWYMVDMLAPETFNKMVVDAADSGPMNGYQVTVSDDGVNFGSAIATGTGKAITTIDFPAQTKCYVKITLTGGGNGWWSIHELNVYPAQGTTIKAPAPRKISAVTSGGTVSIYDITGRVVRQHTCNSDPAKAMKSQYLPGVYIVKDNNDSNHRWILLR